MIHLSRKILYELTSSLLFPLPDLPLHPPLFLPLPPHLLLPTQLPLRVHELTLKSSSFITQPFYFTPALSIILTQPRYFLKYKTIFMSLRAFAKNFMVLVTQLLFFFSGSCSKKCFLVSFFVPQFLLQVPVPQFLVFQLLLQFQCLIFSIFLRTKIQGSKTLHIQRILILCTAVPKHCISSGF